ncbi:gastric triacylglycerol lipase-like [Dreissena polymorpha]|uniref:Lipase n=1 Tax=Dreissena polymorpha TaxID=45954 RepID=A0A9D4M5P0_DREPO|nr:gastric triacylglycerol lipase-like [Dreissena polymorpha]KAH3869739.1 hypothetical protein DPMN_032908 [Dreissena polymorpha]
MKSLTYTATFLLAAVYGVKSYDEPEVYMNTSQLITSKGYPCEEHDVHTQDGYILNIQRIPHGLSSAPVGGSRPVVLLQHGLLSCSACWVENLANNSLGFMMADAGFDVWLGNSRGNTYGRRHEHLQASSHEFWKFSWDEMAKYDLPATVDLILQKTGASQIFYIAHSQGCEIALAQLSHDRALNGKIKAFGALSPAVFLGHVSSPIRLLTPIVSGGEILLNMLGTGEFLPNMATTRMLGRTFCNLPGRLNHICENILFVLAGYDAKQMNESRLPVYIGQHPAGTSTQNIIHYAQSINSGKFQMYDYGFLVNLAKYHQTSAPEYRLEDVTTPILLYTGTNDALVTPTDITKLVSHLPSLVKHTIINGWEHLDFMWAMNAPEMCYNDLIREMKLRV